MAKTEQPKPSPHKTQLIPRLIPFVILAGVFITVFTLYQTGYINLENFPYEIKNAACIGVPYEGFDFAPGLTPLLYPNWNGERSGYTFYLGSGTGFPPMGLILGIDGILRGTPTGKGSNFEVCVKDVGGNSVCRTFHLKVNSECITTIITTTTTNNGNCPTTSNPPCHSIQNGVAVSGVIVPASCNCPSDTTYAGMDNTAPGGPYKICTCK
ncbi:MAG TPA: hypothetical protein VJJ76_02625 [archaeon]|nr:hypothetical protein [archaeon]